MNKDDYVSLEVAKLLKEKGYDEPCCKMYNEKEEDYEYACYMMTKQGFRNYDLCEYEVAIPTLYEAAKWLRNEHGIYVTIISSPITWLYKENDGAYITHFPVITYRDAEGKIKMSHHQGMNDSEYDKAFNCAILEALKLI